MIHAISMNILWWLIRYKEQEKINKIKKESILKSNTIDLRETNDVFVQKNDTKPIKIKINLIKSSSWEIKIRRDSNIKIENLSIENTLNIS